VESTTHTSSDHSAVSVASILIIVVIGAVARRSRLL
jgi:hypothetical protein